MTTYNTGNPIGSKDPRDLYDNAENLDEAVNTRTAESWDDRFGVARKTWWGMERDFQQLLINSGYENIGDYGPGLEITARNQIFWRDGELYRAGASLDLPYTTTGDWGAEEGLFVAVGDAALRQELGGSVQDGQGGAMVRGAVIYVNTIADLQALDTSGLVDGQHVYVKEYYDGTGYGGGLYVNAGSGYSGSDAIEGTDGTQWRMVVDNNVFPIDRLGALKGDPESVKDAFILAIECVREAGSGTVYVGPGEWTMASVYYEVNTSNITFHFDLGCHFKMEYVLLGWYPTAPGKGYSNVAIEGRGTIEALPGTMWHNDFVYVDGIELRSLTFIRPLYKGHFLDLNGCTNVTIDGIIVRGSNIEGTADPRLFTEFIQVGGDGHGGLGWAEKRTEYEPLMNQGIGTTNVTLTNSVFKPYTDEYSVTTYPPRPIGDHAVNPGVGNIRIVGNEFKDVIRQDIRARSSWLEMTTVDGVHISGNSFVFTNAPFIASSSTMAAYIIALRGAANSRGVAILDNTFDITRSAEAYVGCVESYASGAVVSVIGNVFKCAAEFSDLIALKAPGNIKVIGNSVDSTGRRFLFVDSNAGGGGSRCLVQGNDMVFNPPTPADYRHPVETSESTLNIVGNRIQHPDMAFKATSGAVCAAAGNTMMGGAASVEIHKGVLTGNVFNTTAAPGVTIDGVSQTSQGWDFVHVPA